MILCLPAPLYPLQAGGRQGADVLPRYGTHQRPADTSTRHALDCRLTVVPRGRATGLGQRTGRLTALMDPEELRRLGMPDVRCPSAPRTACMVDDESTRCWPLPLFGGRVDRVRYG